MNEQDSVDDIRNSYICFKDKITKKNVFSFIKDITESFNKDLTLSKSIEILDIIKKCFSLYPTQCLPHIKIFVNLSRSNPFYLILATSILSYISQNKQNLHIRNYQYYFNEIIKEIVPQIPKTKYIIFSNEIPPQFNIDLILDILLYSELNSSLISHFSPLIISFFLSGLDIGSKFGILIEKISHLNFICMLAPKNDFLEKISKIIETKKIEYIYQQDESILSILLCSIIFIKKRGYAQISGLNRSTSLPLTAVTILLLKEIKINFFKRIPLKKDSIVERAQLLKNNKSQILISSIESILSNFLSDRQTYAYPIYIYLQMQEILLKLSISNQYNGNKMILISSLLNISKSRYFEKSIKNFYDRNKNEIFQFLIANLTEIKHCEQMKQKILNLNVFDSILFVNHLKSLNSLDDMTEFLSFIDLFCYNEPKAFSDNLIEFVIEKIKEEKWNEVIIIQHFMKQKNIKIGRPKLDELSIPFYVKELLYDYEPSQDDTIDELMFHILDDEHIEKNDNLFTFLFKKMIEDKTILQNYLKYLIAKYNYGNQYSIKTFLRFFSKEYEQFHDDFLLVINKSLYFQKENDILLNRLDFDVSSLPVTYFGYSIVAKLCKNALEKKGNFQAFICLKNISSSFPFLFEKSTQEIFDIVLSALNYFSLVFEINSKEENLKLAKTSYSALLFLISTLRSPVVLDKFVKWLFSNIVNFNDSLILSFFLVLRLFNTDYRVMTIFQIYIKKFDFIEIVGRFLDKEVEKGKFEVAYKENLFGFLEEEYRINDILSNQLIIQIEEFSQLENPFKFFFEEVISQFSFMNKFNKFQIPGVSSEIKQFINDLSQSKDYHIDYDFELRRIKEPTKEQIDNFIGELPSNEPQNELSNINFEGPFSIKMIRYIVKKPIFIQDHLLEKSYGFYLSPEMNELYSNVINDLNNMISESNENQTEENLDISLFKKDNYLSYMYSHHELFIGMINCIKDPTLSDKSFQSIANIFQHILNNNEIYDMILNYISYCFNDILDNILLTGKSLYLKEMSKLLDFLIKCSNNLKTKNNFFEICGNNILNIALSPRIRCAGTVLQKVSQLMEIFDKNMLPSNVIQLIGFMLMSDDFGIMEKPFKLIFKFDPFELKEIFHLFDSAFANIMTKQTISDKAIDFVKFYSIKNKDNLDGKLELLRYCFKQYFSSNQKNNTLFTYICKLFNQLAPKRNSNLKTQVTYEVENVPSCIVATFPSFWNIYNDNFKMFNSKLKNNPFLLDVLNFLLEYPELVDFRIRSSYFRQKMSNKINYDDQIEINVDFDNLFDSSFNALYGQSPEDLLYELKIIGNENTIDIGGPTREWFTKLAKEIFNPNYGLFECSEKNNCYYPSANSSIQPSYLDYFYFIGQFIARALIQGVCIEAFFTTSFCKQILHRHPDIDDLKEVDEVLANGLNWILENEIDPSTLGQKFEIEIDHVGKHETILLKNDGDKIDVTNENKKEYADLLINYVLEKKIEKQVNSFCNGFDSLIPHKDLYMFTSKELQLLICGVPRIDVEDFIAHIKIQNPYTLETPIVKLFFQLIRKWDNDKLAKLLFFMTGSSRVPTNGFEEFYQLSGHSLKIARGGDINKLPCAHTCFNTIDIPPYESEEDLNNKLLLAIQECDTHVLE